ncbi:zinc finger protein 260-like [Strongylocentrotus purpuratus]|uniref:C2H2-type domain-containing protein n=1 Tax=Strongylocentrotus purpuratus TaxID=7668 RepID=A0A7M7P8A0_STRPU|nr:zinc finger protein 260-like [Strongylocentrotus purpuratus]
MSEVSPGDLDGLESYAEIREYDGVSDDEFQDKQDRVKKCLTGNHSSVRSECPGVCPLCSTIWNSLADRTSHLQTHIPKDQGRQAFKEACEAIEKKIGKEYTQRMGWCELKEPQEETAWNCLVEREGIFKAGRSRDSFPQSDCKEKAIIIQRCQYMSSRCLGDQDSLESDDSFEYGGDSDEDVEGKPAHKRKRHQSKNRKPAFKFPEACPICFEAWKEKRKVMHHLQKHIPIDQGPEAIKDAVQSIKSKFEKEHNFDMGWCGECKKLLLRFRTHLNRCHDKNSRYGVLCQQCGKMINSQYIKRHEISHLEIKESDYVQCPQCPSRFKHQQYLKSHVRCVHNKKPRSAQCSTCSKVLKSREHLKRHLVIHSGVKPYSCSMCDKSFTQSSNLKAHMRQHTGDKPYVCELCEMAFNHKVSLKNHKKKLHGIDWWKERESLKKEDPERNKSDGSE